MEAASSRKTWGCSTGGLLAASISLLQHVQDLGQDNDEQTWQTPSLVSEGVLWKQYNTLTQGFAHLLPEEMEQTASRVSAGKQEGDFNNFLMVLPSELCVDLEKRGERSWALLSYHFYIKICGSKALGGNLRIAM